MGRGDRRCPNLAISSASSGSPRTRCRSACRSRPAARGRRQVAHLQEGLAQVLPRRGARRDGPPDALVVAHRLVHLAELAQGEADHGLDARIRLVGGRAQCCQRGGVLARLWPASSRGCRSGPGRGGLSFGFGLRLALGFDLGFGLGSGLCGGHRHRQADVRRERQQRQPCAGGHQPLRNLPSSACSLLPVDVVAQWSPFPDLTPNAADYQEAFAERA